MFWGLIAETGKRYAQRVTNAFHISMAVLDSTSLNVDGDVTVTVKVNDTEYILCRLTKTHNQQAIDYNFETDESVAFTVKGAKAVVHLTGYLIPDEGPEDSFLDESDSGEEVEVDEEDSDEDVPQLTNKRKSVEVAGKPAKKVKMNATPVKLAPKFSADSDEESDDDDEMFLDDDDDSEDETPVKKVNGKAKTPQKQNAIVNKPTKTPGTPHPIKQQNKAGENKTPAKTPKTPKTPNNANTPAQSSPGTPNTESGKKKKNKKKKNKNKNKEGANTPKEGAAGADAPKEQSSVPKASGGTPKTDVLKAKETTEKKLLSGGVIVQDLCMGTGPVAKSGRMVQVYYSGRLKSNNKQFDATENGPGFKFRLGQSEVIRGWDIGVAGMKVGGKRRIVCPPQMAYGKRGALPDIPPNSTLVFDVQLKAVK